MLTKDEFRRKRDALERFSRIFFAVVAGTIVAGFFGFAWAVPRWWAGDWTVRAELGILAAIGVAIWLFRRLARGLGASCPSCRAPLHQVLGQIAVASGRCGKCGTVVCE